MKMIDALIDFLKKSPSQPKEETPKGLCPNCWGREEYGGQFFEAVKNHNVDINSKDPSIGWVQDYANKYLTGIELKAKDDQLVCQNCKLSYKPK